MAINPHTPKLRHLDFCPNFWNGPLLLAEIHANIDASATYTDTSDLLIDHLPGNLLSISHETGYGISTVSQEMR